MAAEMAVQATPCRTTCRQAPVVNGRRNGGSSNKYLADEFAVFVVNGRRNGGSSNRGFGFAAVRFGCEWPPKWRFKQQYTALIATLASCEWPPKWRFKQLPSRPSTVKHVVNGRRNGGSSNGKGLQDPAPALVVNGRRNGGSSNAVYSTPPCGHSCEWPPKWRFKQPTYSKSGVS